MFSLKLQHVLIVLIILEIALSALLSVAILMCFPALWGWLSSKCTAGKGDRRQKEAEGDALGLCIHILEAVPSCI